MTKLTWKQIVFAVYATGSVLICLPVSLIRALQQQMLRRRRL